MVSSTDAVGIQLKRTAESRTNTVVIYLSRTSEGETGSPEYTAFITRWHDEGMSDVGGAAPRPKHYTLERPTRLFSSSLLPGVCYEYFRRVDGVAVQ